MTEHLPDVDQLPSKDKFSAVKEFDEWNAVTGALPDHTSWNYECRSIVEDADKEIARLRNALAGVSTCSTCEACRGAATLALDGAAPATEPKLISTVQMLREVEDTLIDIGWHKDRGVLKRVTDCLDEVGRTTLTTGDGAK